MMAQGLQKLEITNAAEAVCAAMQAHYDASVRGIKAVTALKEAEYTALTTEGLIDGKNAEIRTAQLNQATAAERAESIAAEEQIRAARLALEQAQVRFDALKACARLYAEKS